LKLSLPPLTERIDHDKAHTERRARRTGDGALVA
jgi:hypothetical protein